jgi:hypothetical protein
MFTHPRALTSQEQAQLADLIDGYLAALRRSREGHMPTPDRDMLTFQHLLRRHENSRQSYTKRQRESAEDFNLIAVLQVTDDEKRHSGMLAWLLDRRIEHLGTHAQGSLGFQLFLREMGLPAGYARERYWVRCEVAGEESRVDIEVAARGQFIIHIENKLRAAEGEDQTDREWRDLHGRADALGIARSGRQNAVHAIFLSRDDDLPQNPNFVPISWSRIAGVLEAFAARAKPTDVKLFAAHYAKALRKFTVTKSPREKMENEEEMAQ